MLEDEELTPEILQEHGIRVLDTYNGNIVCVNGGANSANPLQVGFFLCF